MSNHIKSYKVHNTATHIQSAQSNAMKVQVQVFSILFHQDIRSSARTNEEVNLRLNVHLTSSFIVVLCLSVVRNASRFKYFSDSTLSNFYYSSFKSLNLS